MKQNNCKEIGLLYSELIKSVAAFKLEFSLKKGNEWRRKAVDLKSQINITVEALEKNCNGWNYLLGKYQDYNADTPKVIERKRNYQLVNEFQVPGACVVTILPNGDLLFFGPHSKELSLFEKKVDGSFSPKSTLSEGKLRNCCVLPDGYVALIRLNQIILIGGLKERILKLVDTITMPAECSDLERLPGGKILVSAGETVYELKLVVDKMKLDANVISTLANRLAVEIKAVPGGSLIASVTESRLALTGNDGLVIQNKFSSEFEESSGLFSRLQIDLEHRIILGEMFGKIYRVASFDTDGNISFPPLGIEELPLEYDKKRELLHWKILPDGSLLTSIGNIIKLWRREQNGTYKFVENLTANVGQFQKMQIAPDGKMFFVDIDGNVKIFDGEKY